MEKLKSIIILLIILAIIVVAGYWAFATLEPGSLSAEKQKEAELSKENQQLQDQVVSLKDQLAALQSETTPASSSSAGDQQSATSSSSQNQSSTVTYKYQSLIDKLQKLISDNIVMKEKSQGTRVGTVQQFLQVYGDTKLSVDNDYGKSTISAVTSFQKDQGLTADGNAGPSTYQKMIDWLKRQG